MTRLTVLEEVGLERLDDVVYVATLPDGPIVVLKGIAAFIWEVALDNERETVASRVAAATKRPVEEVDEAVSRFIDDLIRRGLLVARSMDVAAPTTRPGGASWHT
jgi:Coenzyme PQQ synthesis protein D (PqqD)